MGKLSKYIKKVEAVGDETLVVNRARYLKNLRELAKLRYTVSKSKPKNKTKEQVDIILRRVFKAYAVSSYYIGSKFNSGTFLQGLKVSKIQPTVLTLWKSRGEDNA